MFGAPVPAFNLKGKQRIQSHIGGCISIIIISVVLIYGINNLQKVITHQNPNINTNLIEGAYD